MITLIAIDLTPGTTLYFSCLYPFNKLAFHCAFQVPMIGTNYGRKQIKKMKNKEKYLPTKAMTTVVLQVELTIMVPMGMESVNAYA